MILGSKFFICLVWSWYEIWFGEMHKVIIIFLTNMSYATYNLVRGKAMSICIEFYSKENGDCPVAEFISKLDKKMAARVIRSIDLLEQHGNDLRAPYSKAINDGIFELRTQQGSDITRVFYFFFVGNKAVITNGFVKKTQKTPPSEIARAINYKKDYERRYRYG